jgi:cell pole-organizing protein PopZ
MSQAAKAQEPSMEEILASIRRIIADDDASKPAKAPEPAALKPPPAAAVPPPAPPPPAAVNNQSDVDAMLAELEAPAPKPEPEPEFEVSPEPAKLAVAPPAADVLDLTEAMTAPSPASNFRTIDGASDVVFSDRAPEPLPAVEPPPPAPPRQFAPPPPPPPLTRPDAGLISNATAAAVDSAFNTLATTVIGQNARTLEDLVKEMLRPMLKSWLDDNLPSLVERIVRAEIERVSRGKP